MNTYYLRNRDMKWVVVPKQTYLNMKYSASLPEFAVLGDTSDMFKIVRGQNKPNRKHNKGKLFKGVSLQRGKYVARFEGRYLGRFALDKDAAMAYDEAAIEKYGVDAVTNFTRR